MAVEIIKDFTARGEALIADLGTDMPGMTATTSLFCGLSLLACSRGLMLSLLRDGSRSGIQNIDSAIRGVSPPPCCCAGVGF